MPKRKSTYRVLVILEVDEVYENHDRIRELTHAVLSEFKTEAEGVEFLGRISDTHATNVEKPHSWRPISMICDEVPCVMLPAGVLRDGLGRVLGFYCRLHSDLKLRWLEMQNEPVKRRAS